MAYRNEEDIFNDDAIEIVVRFAGSISLSNKPSRALANSSGFIRNEATIVFILISF